MDDRDFGYKLSQIVGACKRWVLLTLVFIVIGTNTNCSGDFRAQEYLKISTSCGETKTLTKPELFELVEANHHKSEANPQIRCPGFFAVIDGSDSKNAFEKTRFINNNCNREFPSEREPEIPPPSLSKDEWIAKLIDQVDGGHIDQWVDLMSDGSLWPTRYHRSSTNNEVGQWIVNEFKKLMPASRTDIVVRLVDHENTPQKSVEVIIPGSGVSDKYIVLGGHLDSIHQTNSGGNPDARAPGADDNASGIAILLETFRVLMTSEFRPQKTLVFYGYAAEEIGLVGSQEIARSYSNEGKQVVGVMQIDMAMYSSSGSSKIRFVSDYTSKNLTELAQGLAQDYLGLEVELMKCGYGCSDHASWNKYSFPSFMPAEDEMGASVSRIHSASDMNDSKMNPSYAAKFSQLALAFVVSMDE